MNIIGTRAVERVYLADPDEHPEAPSWEVRFGDADIERMKTVVGDAIERAQALTDERELRERLGDAEGAREVARETARFEKRVITAFIGADGYREALAWVAGEDADAADYVTAMGDVMAALLLLFAERAGNGRLRQVSAAMSRRPEAFVAPKPKAKPKRKGQGKGRGRR